MSDLADLVPPLSLCMKIPQGKFADSALVWVMRKKCFPDIAPRGFVFECDVIYPAPTLNDILPALDDLGLCCPTAKFDCVEWSVYWIDNHVNEIVCARKTGKNPSTCALELWLEEQEGAE